MREELIEIKAKYGDPRRSEIIDAPADMEDEDLIPVEDVVITLSSNGYVKRIAQDTYRVQNRGGKGIKGMELNNDDVIDQFVSMSTHDYLLVFTSLGRVYRIRGFNIPSYGRTSKGLPIVNLLQMDKNESVKALVPYGKEDSAKYLLFATQKGLVKRTAVSEFENINRNGKIAIKLNEDDELAFVKGTSGEADIVIAVTNGKAIRFKEKTLRPLGRTARGVKGVNVDGGAVIGMTTSEEGKMVLTVTENGYGKKSPMEDFRMTNRGAKGVKAVTVTEKTGNLVCMKAVNGDEDCMIMTNDGIIIRITLTQVSTYSRSAQGVRLINVKDDDEKKVSTVAIVAPIEEEAEESAE